MPNAVRDQQSLVTTSTDSPHSATNICDWVVSPTGHPGSIMAVKANKLLYNMQSVIKIYIFIGLILLTR